MRPIKRTHSTTSSRKRHSQAHTTTKHGICPTISTPSAVVFENCEFSCVTDRFSVFQCFFRFPATDSFLFMSGRNISQANGKSKWGSEKSRWLCRVRLARPFSIFSFRLRSAFLYYIRNRIAFSAAGREKFYGFFAEYTCLRRCRAFSKRSSSAGVGVSAPISSSRDSISISAVEGTEDASRSLLNRRRDR